MAKCSGSGEIQTQDTGFLQKVHKNSLKYLFNSVTDSVEDYYTQRKDFSIPSPLYRLWWHASCPDMQLGSRSSQMVKTLSGGQSNGQVVCCSGVSCRPCPSPNYCGQLWWNVTLDDESDCHFQLLNKNQTYLCFLELYINCRYYWFNFLPYITVLPKRHACDFAHQTLLVFSVQH